ncbi:hypothetical protein RRG08_021923 [Elysia crispata]|uniref:Uncharacterized protein n=1 Tax=Elysia crispata TaxID=231223 RepID=A0AAE1AC19_9GAST|nr:hypothetical protein RRG08_021923 [Elysia crispata]
MSEVSYALHENSTFIKSEKRSEVETQWQKETELEENEICVTAHLNIFWGVSTQVEVQETPGLEIKCVNTVGVLTPSLCRYTLPKPRGGNHHGPQSWFEGQGRDELRKPLVSCQYP